MKFPLGQLSVGESCPRGGGVRQFGESSMGKLPWDELSVGGAVNVSQEGVVSGAGCMWGEFVHGVRCLLP